MALAADLGIVETDRLTAVVSAASAVTAASISIADSCTFDNGFYLLYAWQLRHSPTHMQYILLVKTKLAATTNPYCPSL